MNQPETHFDDLVQVDEICDAFESALRRGESPQIASYLDRVDPAHRSTLVRELVTLEVGVRVGRGERLSAVDLVQHYAPLLPASDDRETVIREAIEKALASTAKLVDPNLQDTVTFARPEEPSSKATRPFPRVRGFQIESVLGRGGMGIVYKAMQDFPRRPVALKMILDQKLTGDRESDEFFERFKKEAQAVADLNDPHFVQIYAFGMAGGRPYMAFEFADGGSLEKYRHGEPQSVEFSTQIVEHLARGMQQAHRANVVHRDLKPHNVLLTSQGVAKIADFGLVKRLDHDAQLTEEGRPVGTPSYMAPEQTYGTKDVGKAADIYALGGILYCLLTGRPPFQAANWRDTFDQVCTQEPVPPSRLNPKISKDLETICLKCLQKEPEKRYATAEDLADDLRRFQEGRPILARSVGRIEVAWRWARRNPWIAGLGTGVAALTVTIAVVSTVMSWQLSLRNSQITSQNVEISRKSEQLTVANNLTQEQRDASLEVVRNVLLSVDNEVRDNPTLFRLRRQLIDEALKGLDVVRDKAVQNPLVNPENPLVERTEAMAHQRMGDMYLQGDRIADAAKEFAIAFEILDRLNKTNPTDPVNARNLAGIYNSRGAVELRLGNTPKARDDYRAALSLRQQWSRMLPQHSPARWAIAQSHGLVGKVSLMLGDPASALESLQSAKTIFESLPPPPEPGEVMTLRRERAANEQRLGEVSLQLGQATEAENYFQVALQQRQEAARDGKNHSLLRRDLALSRMSLGNFFLLERNDPGKAWEQYDQALGIFLPLARDHPTGSLTRRDLAAVQYRLGATFRRAREQKLERLPNGQAVPDPSSHFEQSRKLREALAQIDPRDTQSKIEWALAVARCGGGAEAEKLAQELAAPKEAALNPYVLFQVACTFSLCSESMDPDVSARCRKQALETLEALVKTDWKDLIALKNDPDLDPIRADPEFTKRMTDISRAMPAENKGPG